MSKKERFYIKTFTNPSGAKCYRVQGRMPDGKMIRKNFGVYDEALAAKQAFEVQALNLENTIRLVNTRLTPGQMSEAEAAFRVLDKAAARDQRFKDLPLLQILDFGLKNYRDPSCEAVVSDAVQEFMEAKEKENHRPRTISNLRSRLNPILAQVGDKLVSQITFQDLHAIVYEEGLHGLTQRNRLSVAKGFFSWCLRKGYCADNPANAVNLPAYDEEEPEILSLPEVVSLLKAASEFKRGKLVPYVAIGLFAALRPAELGRITWNRISLESQLIRLGGKIAKKRQRRNVELSSNLIQWLRPHVGRDIVPPNWRRDFDAIRRIAGFRGSVDKRQIDERLKPWPTDVIRHTSISAHFALHEHEGKTARWAGNTPDVVHTHYKGLTTMEEAGAFWSLSPDNLGAVVIQVATSVA
jgi:site-specific recombinase XerC